MSKSNLTPILLLAFAPFLSAGPVPGKYIVELRGEPAALRGVRPASAVGQARRARVREEQRQARQRIEARQARVLDAVDTVANAMFVECPEAAVAELAAQPGVKRVVPMRRFRLLLDRAALLHKVNEAWNRIGNEGAGAGVKIAIIDTGIDSAHAGFQDPSMTAPDGFPRANEAGDLTYTSGKVIVARSYVNLLEYRDPDYSARDRVGHGTALAMIAAGRRTEAPHGVLEGVAPRAYLGNYKVFGTPGYNDTTTDAAILKAIDDAVADGMDVINLSLGDDFAPRLADDIDVQAVERAVQAGVIVVAAAGNNGPDMNTISSPATAPSAIAVGAVTNDRTLAASVELQGGTPQLAVTGSGPLPAAPITASLTDVASLDTNGLACVTLPAGSLSGHVALILRGTCTFESKLDNAQRAGAVAALVYAAVEAPEPFVMGVGQATLPAQMISHEAGLRLKESKDGVVTLRFTVSAVPRTAGRITDFTAIGPGVDLGIKPDLAAVGGDMYTATQTLDSRGDMYDASGFVLVDGTSFSAPLVAGAAAVVKSARPGLTVEQYRSLLIHGAARLESTLQESGAGMLDVDAALRNTATAAPVSLSFGAGGGDVQFSRTLKVTNTGANAEAFTVTVTPKRDVAAPQAPAGTGEVAPGATVEVPVEWSASGLTAGTYEGFVTVQGLVSGTTIQVPYWYAVTSNEPARITVLSTTASGRRGATVRDAVLIRVTDAAGVIVPNVVPRVTVVSGGGAFQGAASYDRESPGVLGLSFTLGAGAGVNVFRVEAGGASREITITGI
jgi:subtilisin family serine protease